MGVTHLSGLEVAGVPTFGIGGAPMFTGNWYFVDAVNGSDGNTGAADSPLATIYVAYSKTVSGHNDVVVIVGNGSTTGTQRLSVANAAIATPGATTGTLTWANNATHLIGMTAPSANSQRARIAPVTTDTMALFGSGNFVVVTGQGCYFSNFSVFNGFATGGASQIAWTDSGGRNYYNNVDIEGAGDTASATATTSRSLLITGSVGENTFDYCTFGTDTVQRTVANATLEFAAGTPRNTFRRCHFPAWSGSAGTPLFVLGTGAACMDRWQSFEDCVFYNAIKSTGTAMAVAISFTNASPGGFVLLKSCTSIGVTKWGDTNGLANTYVDGGAPTNSSTGLAVNPT